MATATVATTSTSIIAGMAGAACRLLRSSHLRRLSGRRAALKLDSWLSRVFNRALLWFHSD
jgi:hypothetical protein